MENENEQRKQPDEEQHMRNKLTSLLVSHGEEDGMGLSLWDRRITNSSEDTVQIEHQNGTEKDVSLDEKETKSTSNNTVSRQKKGRDYRQTYKGRYGQVKGE
ncbi:hypothetical protein SNEBB_011068 [Seison nebaliae]|nr:hypothetical protein SNEBB_011068 [Seison nebaliae]